MFAVLYYYSSCSITTCDCHCDNNLDINGTKSYIRHYDEYEWFFLAKSNYQN